MIHGRQHVHLAALDEAYLGVAVMRRGCPR